MKNFFLLILLFSIPLFSQQRFIEKKGWATTNWDTLSLPFFCWNVGIYNHSLTDTLFVTTDQNKENEYTLTIPPLTFISLITADSFNKLYVRSNSVAYYQIITTTGARR